MFERERVLYIMMRVWGELAQLGLAVLAALLEYRIQAAAVTFMHIRTKGLELVKPHLFACLARF